MRVGAVSMAAFMEDDDEVEDPYSAIPDILKPTAQKEDDGKNRLEAPLSPALARISLYSLQSASSTHNSAPSYPPLLNTKQRSKQAHGG